MILQTITFFCDSCGKMETRSEWLYPHEQSGHQALPAGWESWDRTLVCDQHQKPEPKGIFNE